MRKEEKEDMWRGDTIHGGTRVSLVSLMVFHGIPVRHAGCALPKGLFCRLTSRHTVEAHGDRNSAGR